MEFFDESKTILLDMVDRLLRCQSSIRARGIDAKKRVKSRLKKRVPKRDTEAEAQDGWRNK